MLHGTTDLRMLLARAYFHSAQLGRAETTLRRIVHESPTDAYAHLLLGRTLQRAGRHAEAAQPLALAEILGGYERPDAYGAPDDTDAESAEPTTGYPA
jgi:Flp pilus assembly protein TadD